MPTQTATLAGGCFWCIETVFNRLAGVESAVSGYMGGHTPNPTYRDICNGDTGHAEVVQVTFDPDVISFRELLDVFFTIHDPTQPNRQGNGVGTQYRSAIFWHTPEQKIAERYCVPTSLPWRLRWVGSWIVKKTSSRSRKAITSGS